MQPAIGDANEFDVCAMYAAMDAQRTERGLSWPQAARALWDQSKALNERLHDHPISPSTLTGIARRGDCTCQHALFILRWLERPPEAFLHSSPPGPGPIALPAAGEDRRLRWDLEAVFEAVNDRRKERGLTWREVARELHCTDHQIAGLRKVRFAIGMKLMMRIMRWLGRPAADFIDAADW